MKNVLIALIAVISTACVSRAEFDTLQRRNAELEQKDLARRQQNARRDGYRPPGSPQLPTASPTPPAVNNGMMGQGQSTTGVAWTYQKHGVYMGTVGAQSRQVTQGRKLELTNKVCDDDSRTNWSNCGDADMNGYPDLNTWLAFEIDGQPVICDSGFFHPESQDSLLPPGQTCHVEVGRSTKVTLTIKAYRNSGTPKYVMLDSTPYTADKSVRIRRKNSLSYVVDETVF
jgi:hypothetical protein